MLFDLIFVAVAILPLVAMNKPGIHLKVVGSQTRELAN
jgi:hypothetical protein